MKKIILLFAVVLFSVCARADLITATVTITNVPVNGNTIVINSITYTWANTVTSPAIQIQTTNTIAAASTNLLSAIELALPSGINNVMTNGSTTGMIISGLGLTLSTTGSWSTNTFATNTVTGAQVVEVPLTALPAGQRATIANGLVNGIDTSASVAFSTGDNALANYDSLSGTQTISGVKTFSATNGINGGVGGLTNGSWMSPLFTNAVNRGNAMSSVGAGLLSEQFGAGASAGGTQSLAVGEQSAASSTSDSAFGVQATASGGLSTAIGAFSTANKLSATAVGQTARAQGTNSTAIGQSSTASKLNSTAIGTSSSATGTNSSAFGENATTSGNDSFSIGENASEIATNAIAIGNNVTNSAANEITIGSSSQYTRFNGSLMSDGSYSNFVSSVSAVLGGSVQYPRINNTGLANGANQDVATGTNAFIKVSGPTGAFSIVGLAGGANGTIAIIENATGQTMTIQNDSGLETTPANRIYTGTGVDIGFTANPATLYFIYDSASTHWILNTPATTTLGNIPFSLTQTNFVSGQLYTNSTGAINHISANAILTIAAISGNADMDLRVAGTVTNSVGMNTLITSIAMIYTNHIAIDVPAGSTYVFTNMSAGAGNSASISGGQIMVY